MLLLGWSESSDELCLNAQRLPSEISSSPKAGFRDFRELALTQYEEIKITEMLINISTGGDTTLRGDVGTLKTHYVSYLSATIVSPIPSTGKTVVLTR